MRSVRYPGGRTRAALVTGGVAVATACIAPESTDFFDEPHAIVGDGGTGGQSGSSSTGGAGASGTASGAAGTTAGGAGSAAAASGGSGLTAGSGGSAATAGTDPTSGASGSGPGSGGSGGRGDGGAAGDVTSQGGVGEGGSGGSGGSVSCEAYGETAQDFDGHCYLFVDEPVTWQSAIDACGARGAHLVTLSSENRLRSDFQAENAFVWELGSMTPVWIAATDGKGPLEQGDGTYYAWTTDEPMTFDNWSEAQPNNSPAACQDDNPCSCDEDTCYEHCGFQWATPGKDATLPGWNDRLCEHQIAYVCEWDDP